ncbi:glycosyltransferase family 25 protein [Patellaria atrata CBS 101060]|uniref:Glycosyltransferase family 25 protein n=1 Tax=Patellaria atrata CBS 101060 TaxID=1346257 RepID=A0A9P4VMN4_9PEZI|nr:glycosyltransferase family 25 protein [Patellaria atrata CBS 101060]
MADRTDKRDALSIAASVTGLKIEFLDGVNGALVPEKAIPIGWPEGEDNHTLGCWRAHMNAIQKIVREQIPSALIMEDDADWDVTLKAQMAEFARATLHIESLSPTTSHQTLPATTPDSPYGTDWDLLWLGHCGTRNREDRDQPYYLIPSDPTAVPQSQWGYPRRQPNMTPAPLAGTYNRIVYEPVRGLCMFGYALSLRGARRLLYHQAISGEAAVSDRALQKICNDRPLGFRCIAPYPTLIGTHRAAGTTAKDSDREDRAGGFREKAVTGQIVFSTRLNLERILGGEGSVLTQWPGESMLEEWNLTSGVYPRGRGVWVAKEEYLPFERPN